jgi:glycosyltransferase involved in cell wall biosynthesis
MTRTVGVVVPAYRPDVSVLARYVEALQAELDPETIRIELDAADESVVEATREALARTQATVNAVARRRGKGAAITAGFEALDTDVLAFADADGSTPAESIGDVVAAVSAGETDVAVGSRRHPEAEVRSHQTILRQHLGDAFAWIARRLLPIGLRDYQCGAKAMTRATWTGIREHLYEPGFAWDVEVIAMAHALGFDVSEVPVVWIDHPDSTVATTNAVPELFRALLRARRRASMLKRGPVSGREFRPERDDRPLVRRDR